MAYTPIYVDTDTIFFKQKLNIIPANVTPKAVILELPQEEVNRLGHEQVYNVQTFMKVITEETRIRNFLTTFRIGVFNEPITENITTYERVNDEGEIEEIMIDSTDYNNLSYEDILENTVWSNSPKNPNEYSNLICQFRYNKDYPLYVIITSDDKTVDLADIKFTSPCIVESQYFNDYEESGLFPIPIMNTLSINGSSEIVIPSYSSANTLIFYKLDLPSDFNSDGEFSVRGIELTGEIEQSDEIAISAKLLDHNNETRVRSVIVTPDDIDFTLGRYGDTWGFKDIQNIRDWEIHLTPSNTLSDGASSLNFKNIQFGVYLEEIQESKVKTYIDGEDLDYYGVFLTDVKKLEGLKTDVKYLNISGSDLNEPLRQTIQEKTIELDFELDGHCDINGNTLLLQDITKLFVNERDEYNRPIKKTIEFSHFPGLCWDYIIDEGFTPDLEVGSYMVKVKFTIPDGTAYTKTPTISTHEGYVDGLTHIHPLIRIKPTKELINITELFSNQSFNMGYTNYDGKIIILDCENQKAYLQEDDDEQITDISQYVDISSDWFRLYRDYNFQIDGGIIQSVQYRERW